jgi:arylsulfatase A-like enzyme
MWDRGKSTWLAFGRNVRYNPCMNAICFVIDRLHAGYLGAYGNSWIETPALDRLAGQSLVFDHALVDSPQLERLYRSYWQGWHAMCPAPPESRPTLAALLREAGVTTALLTDEPQVARHPLAVDFDELIEIDPPWQPQTAGQIDQTQFARCFVQIIDWLESARGPFLLWCHLGGLGTTWDAPLKFRHAYRDEGDPPPPEAADVPERMLPANHDPDELLGIAQSYAGQVTMFDTCMGAMLDFLDGLPTGQESLLTLQAARGFPLGEHLRVGPCDDALYGELVHVPLLMRLPDAAAAAVRSPALVEPADLWATLLDWWNVGGAPQSPTGRSLLPIVRQQSDALRDRLCIAGNGHERAIRTPAWHLRAGGEETRPDAEPELFAKPDDRWEVNNVATRCREVVEGLQEALGQYELALPDCQASDLPPLGEVLRDGL